MLKMHLDRKVDVKLGHLSEKFITYDKKKALVLASSGENWEGFLTALVESSLTRLMSPVCWRLLKTKMKICSRLMVSMNSGGGRHEYWF